MSNMRAYNENNIKETEIDTYAEYMVSSALQKAADDVLIHAYLELDGDLLENASVDLYAEHSLTSALQKAEYNSKKYGSNYNYVTDTESQQYIYTVLSVFSALHNAVCDMVKYISSDFHSRDVLQEIEIDLYAEFMVSTALWKASIDVLKDVYSKLSGDVLQETEDLYAEYLVSSAFQKSAADMLKSVDRACFRGHMRPESEIDLYADFLVPCSLQMAANEASNCLYKVSYYVDSLQESGIDLCAEFMVSFAVHKVADDVLKVGQCRFDGITLQETKIDLYAEFMVFSAIQQTSNMLNSVSRKCYNSVSLQKFDTESYTDMLQKAAYEVRKCVHKVFSSAYSIGRITVGLYENLVTLSALQKHVFDAWEEIFANSIEEALVQSHSKKYNQTISESKQVNVDKHRVQVSEPLQHPVKINEIINQLHELLCRRRQTIQTKHEKLRYGQGASVDMTPDRFMTKNCILNFVSKSVTDTNHLHLINLAKQTFSALQPLFKQKSVFCGAVINYYHPDLDKMSQSDFGKSGFSVQKDLIVSEIVSSGTNYPVINSGIKDSVQYGQMKARSAFSKIRERKLTQQNSADVQSGRQSKFGQRNVAGEKIIRNCDQENFNDSRKIIRHGQLISTAFKCNNQQNQAWAVTLNFSQHAIEKYCRLRVQLHDSGDNTQCLCNHSGVRKDEFRRKVGSHNENGHLFCTRFETSSPVYKFVSSQAAASTLLDCQQSNKSEVIDKDNKNHPEKNRHQNDRSIEHSILENSVEDQKIQSSISQGSKELSCNSVILHPVQKNNEIQSRCISVCREEAVLSNLLKEETVVPQDDTETCTELPSSWSEVSLTLVEQDDALPTIKLQQSLQNSDSVHVGERLLQIQGHWRSRDTPDEFLNVTNQDKSVYKVNESNKENIHETNYASVLVPVMSSVLSQSQELLSVVETEMNIRKIFNLSENVSRGKSLMAKLKLQSSTSTDSRSSGCLTGETKLHKTATVQPGMKGLFCTSEIHSQEDKDITGAEEKHRNCNWLLCHKPTRSTSGKQPCALSTNILFDEESFSDAEKITLPGPSKDGLHVLLVARLVSNGHLRYYQDPSHESVDTDGIPFTYMVLLSWLLSLVPEDLTKKIPNTHCPFIVEGLQQGWMDESLNLFVAVAPNKNLSRMLRSIKRLHTFGQKFRFFYKHVTSFLSTRPLRNLCKTWLQELCDEWKIYWHCRYSHILEDWNDISGCYDADDAKYTFPNLGLPLPFSVLDDKTPVSMILEAICDPNAVNKAFAVANDFVWQTVDTEDLSYGNLNGIMPPDVIGYRCQHREFSDTKYFSRLMLQLIQDGLELAGIRLVYDWEHYIGSLGGDFMLQPHLLCAIRGHCGRAYFEDILKNGRYFSSLHRPFTNLKTSENNLSGAGYIDHRLAEWFGVCRNTISKQSSLSESLRKWTLCTVTATTTGSVLVLLSPRIPKLVVPTVLYYIQERGYLLQKLRHIPLKTELMSGLNLSHSWHDMQDEYTVSFLLAKENASYHLPNLVELICQIVYRVLRDRTHVHEQTLHISDIVAALPYSVHMGKLLTKAFDDQPKNSIKLPLLTAAEKLYFNQELQVVVVIFTHIRVIQTGGAFLRYLSEYSRCLLLGIKFVESLSAYQASEVTPYEPGAMFWSHSIRKLTGRPGLIMAVQGIHAHSHILCAVSEVLILCEQERGDSIRLEELFCGDAGQVDIIVSPSTEIAYRYISLFFTKEELFHMDHL